MPMRARGGAIKKADGGPIVPMAGGPGRFSALERVGKGYQPPAPKPKAKGGGIDGEATKANIGNGASAPPAIAMRAAA